MAVINNPEKQKTRDFVIKELKKFLRINNGSDIVISMLPEEKWIVEHHIAQFIKEINFQGNVVCLFYEIMPLLYKHEKENNFSVLKENLPKNCFAYYYNKNMPSPYQLSNIFDGPIFYWGDFCRSYQQNLLNQFYLSHKNKNSVVFLTFSLYARLNKPNSKKVKEELDNFKNVFVDKNPFEINTLVLKSYRSNKYSMLFFGYDNYDYSEGNAWIYNLRHNIKGDYKFKYPPTCEQIHVYARKRGYTLKQIENIV